MKIPLENEGKEHPVGKMMLSHQRGLGGCRPVGMVMPAGPCVWQGSHSPDEPHHATQLIWLLQAPLGTHGRFSVVCNGSEWRPSCSVPRVYIPSGRLQIEHLDPFSQASASIVGRALHINGLGEPLHLGAVTSRISCR